MIWKEMRLRGRSGSSLWMSWRLPEARLKDDLGIDSLEVVDVVVFVEEKFGFRMKPEDFRNIATFADFCDYIEKRA